MNCDKTTTIFLVGNDLDYVLFKLAIDSAQRGLTVWFISVKRFEEVPKEIQRPSKEVLQLITFIYLNNFMDLVRHLNGIHKWTNTPNVLILKDFEQYCGLHTTEYDSQRTAFLTALLLDSISFLSNKKESEAFLLVSCDKRTGNEDIFKERLKVLFDMYFDYFFFQNEPDTEELIKKIKYSYFKNDNKIL